MRGTEPKPGDANGVSTVSSYGSKAAEAPTSMIPEEQLGLEELCGRIHGRIAAFLEGDVEDETLKRVQDQTRTALGVIDEALEKYELKKISLSYNGGKDCLVLLVLYLSALHTHHLRHCCSSASAAKTCWHFVPVQSVYIKAPHPFHEVEEFVADSEAVYSLDLHRYTAPSMKDAFAHYLADHPEVKLIFVGTRRTDPHGALLTHFDATDGGWPPFMRCHPVIDWHYVDVWAFIRYLCVPYCKLYDLGYTSLGGTNDTLPNPVLRLKGSTPIEPRFRPAYELVEDDEERLGRERVVKAALEKQTVNRSL